MYALHSWNWAKVHYGTEKPVVFIDVCWYLWSFRHFQHYTILSLRLKCINVLYVRVCVRVFVALPKSEAKLHCTAAAATTTTTAMAVTTKKNASFCSSALVKLVTFVCTYALNNWGVNQLQFPTFYWQLCVRTVQTECHSFSMIVDMLLNHTHLLMHSTHIQSIYRKTKKIELIERTENIYLFIYIWVRDRQREWQDKLHTYCSKHIKIVQFGLGLLLIIRLQFVCCCWFLFYFFRCPIHILHVQCFFL